MSSITIPLRKSLNDSFSEERTTKHDTHAREQALASFMQRRGYIVTQRGAFARYIGRRAA